MTVALLDANVLYPAALRDLLLHLSVEGMYQARWSNAIHDEWTRNLLLNKPNLSPDRVARTRRLMDAAVKGSLVRDFNSIPRFSLPDPDDWHVLAAAVKSEANLIVTYNLKDFPAEILTPLNIEAIHPDPFLSQLLMQDTEGFISALKKQRSRLSAPPLTAKKLLSLLENLSLGGTVEKLRAYRDDF